MQSMQMITVTDDYKPLAGSGHNTIRKFDGKYHGLMVGDSVIMHYTDDPQTTGPSSATELLTVTAVAIAPLDVLLKNHGKMNHDYSKYKTVAKLRNHIRGFYPVVTDANENPVDDSGDLYMAIYF